MTDGAELFVACAPGLEGLLAEEIRELELTGAKLTDEAGGVTLVLEARPLDAIARLNLELGVAAQVRWRLGRFRATRLPELVKKTSRLGWQALLTPERSLRIRASAKKSRLYHTGAIAERVRAGVADALGAAPPEAGDDEGDAVVVHARLVRDEVVLSVDTSGAPLHRRGYRLASAKAPLREDLARALIRASGWDAATPFVDPFCGSGTLPIEAALLARRLPPGRGRSFAFEAFPGGPASRAAAERGAAARVAAATPPIHGSDRDAGAVHAACENAARAGVAEDLTLSHAALSAAPGLALPVAPVGAVVTNPPWGARIGGDLRALYQRLGSLLAELPEGWRVAMAAGDPRLARRVGRPLRLALQTRAGGRKAVFLVG